MIPTDKLVLDACCGGRMMWFNKEHPDALYVDVRREEKGFCKHRKQFEVQPDVQADFKELPFPDKKFKLIVWDPPHKHTLGKTSVMAQKYGVLNAETWPYELAKGFEELWRVLDDNGTLIFKWNEGEIPLSSVLSLFKQKPLFGHSTGKNGRSNTMWVCFFKSANNVTTSTEVLEAEALRTPPNPKGSGIRAGDLL